MKLEQVSLPVNNRVLVDYWSDNAKIHSFFQYRLNDEAYSQRFQYLQQQYYDREALVNVIRSYMEPLHISQSADQHLLNLQQGAPVIVGGQQAGLLTGPLYAVHKAITVILLAKQQSEQLGTPVVPLFWIAGEDHDLDEINHIFTIQQAKVKKRGYSERSILKTMASATQLDHQAVWTFIETVFRDYGETAYTASLLQDVRDILGKSTTFTDFFANCMNKLFQSHGLLMIDAADPLFRQYESHNFVKIIEQSAQIAEVVTAKEAQLAEAGYGMPIDAKENAANLFYVKNGERFLLERKQHHFVNLNVNVKWTTEQLIDIAKESPELLSNNVVTRPLMQEMSLPVLAFVGGPGELAYWATLKDAFTVLGLQMPIFVPRLNITMVTRQVEQLLNSTSLTITDVFDGKEQQIKEEYLTSIQDQYVQNRLEEMAQYMHAHYEELTQYLSAQQLHLEKIVIKNKENHYKQLQYLRQKVQQAIEVKHAVAIRQFDTLTSELMPNGGYQERAFSPFQYMNIYGPSLIDDVLAKDIQLTKEHVIIYL